jgi:uncharacterized Tic20 family protein
MDRSVEYDSSFVPGPVVDPSADESERTYALFQHLIGLLGLFDGGFIVGLIGSIVMWRIKANDSPFLDDHGREAVNFQLSLAMYAILGTAVIALVSLGLLVIPWIIFLYVLRLVGCIRGAMWANRGQYFRYPMTIRFLG